MGWDNSILFLYTEAATIPLLDYLVIQKQTIDLATSHTMKEVCIDPAYSSRLAYCPYRVGDQTIETVKTSG